MGSNIIENGKIVSMIVNSGVYGNKSEDISYKNIMELSKMMKKGMSMTDFIKHRNSTANFARQRQEIITNQYKSKFENEGLDEIEAYKKLLRRSIRNKKILRTERK